MENIQSKMKQLFGNSCYIYCIGYLRGLRDIKDLTRFVLQAWRDGNVEDDGYVAYPDILMGCRLVNKVPYKPSAKDQIVCWEYNGKTHFVVMRNGNVVFDPSGDSDTVKFGNIKDAREFVR